MSFSIKPGYVENPEPDYFPDTNHYGVLSQPDVYPFAERLADDGFLVDLGCGRAHKLAQIHERHTDWRIVGVDYGENIAWCREHRDWGEWCELDLEHEHELDGEGAVVVCADVIEHLRDPRPLLASIRRSGCKGAVLSTPERDLTWGDEHNGPPPNTCHVREWNRAELASFLVAEGFQVRTALTLSDDAGSGYCTTLAMLR